MLKRLAQAYILAQAAIACDVLGTRGVWNSSNMHSCLQSVLRARHSRSVGRLDPMSRSIQLSLDNLCDLSVSLPVSCYILLGGLCSTVHADASLLSSAPHANSLHGARFALLIEGRWSDLQPSLLGSNPGRSDRG